MLLSKDDRYMAGHRLLNQVTDTHTCEKGTRSVPQRRRDEQDPGESTLHVPLVDKS